MKNYGRQILRKWNIFRVFFFILSFCLCADGCSRSEQFETPTNGSTVFGLNKN